MSDWISDMHCIRPVFLLLVPIAIGVWWMWQRRLDPLLGWRKQMQPELLEALTVGCTSVRKGSALWVLGSWLLAAIAIAGPTWRIEPSPFADDATPLLLLLKADVSMDLPDPAPSRIERAQLKIADIANARKGQPLGLMAYAGSPHLVLPPTRDTEIVAAMAAEITPAIMPSPGDQLNLALLKGAELLDEGKKGGSIVVVADTVDTDASALKAAGKELRYPVYFLTIQAAESSQDESMNAAASALGATVVPMSADDTDIATIVRHAAGAMVAQSGEQGDRWQEAGYWLVPVIGLLLLVSFRREQKEAVS